MSISDIGRYHTYYNKRKDPPTIAQVVSVFKLTCGSVSGEHYTYFHKKEQSYPCPKMFWPDDFKKIANNIYLGRRKDNSTTRPSNTEKRTN